MIDNRSIQRALAAGGFYKGRIDGVIGNKTRAAIEAALIKAKVDPTGWPHSRRMIAINQWILKNAKIDPGPIDGWMGEGTRFALERWQNKLRDSNPDAGDIRHQPDIFPRQADMAEFYGKPGTGHTKMKLPYPMRLAWDPSTVITRMTIHSKCAASAEKALGRTLEHYGQARIQSLGLDLFGGCFNNRAMRGGRTLSTHAYAAAIDFNPEANQLRWGSDRAAMAAPQCAPFLDFFEEEGWISLGRERNFDWMHLQAARL